MQTFSNAEVQVQTPTPTLIRTMKKLLLSVPFPSFRITRFGIAPPRVKFHANFRFFAAGSFLRFVSFRLRFVNEFKILSSFASSFARENCFSSLKIEIFFFSRFVLEKKNFYFTSSCVEKIQKIKSNRSENVTQNFAKKIESP